MKLEKDGFWSAENTGEILNTYRINEILLQTVPDSYRIAIGAACEEVAVLEWEVLVLRYMQQVDVWRPDAEQCVATNLASFVTNHYPVEIAQRVMRLYPLCRTTSYGRLVPMPDESPAEPPITDRVQLEKIMDCEDKDWEYFARTDPTPTLTLTARDFVSNGGGCLYWPQIHIGGYVDSISVVDCETGEEMLKTPSEADIASWSKPATPYVVELRSDDNEPLTVEWLDSVRPALGENSYAWQIATAKVFFDVRFCNQTLAYYVCICDDTFKWQRVFDATTRGEVRAICRALKAVVPM